VTWAIEYSPRLGNTTSEKEERQISDSKRKEKTTTREMEDKHTEYKTMKSKTRHAIQ
jgi:hypothetical protein